MCVSVCVYVYLDIYTYIFIYIYISTCVCVCVYRGKACNDRRLERREEEKGLIEDLTPSDTSSVRSPHHTTYIHTHTHI